MKQKLFTLFLALIASVNATFATSTEITVAKALEIGAALSEGAITDDTYDIVGYVTQIDDNSFNTSYKNMVFWIADENNGAATNAAGAFEVYRGKPTQELKVGDKVSVKTKIQNYKGLIESVSNAPVNFLEEGTGTGSGETSAADVVFTAVDFAGQGVSSTGGAVSATKDGVTFTCDKGFGYQYAVRYYKGSTVTITSATEQIGKIEFDFDTVSGTSYDGGLEPVTVVNAKEWTVALPSQARMNKISIYFGTAEDVGYTGTCGANLRWTLSNGTLTISGTGAMEDYYYNVVSPWYDYRSSILSVIISDGVTSIGSCAFKDCSSLTSVTIGNSVTSIGWSAFEGCSSLTSITIPNSVTSIGELAFRYCSSLTSVTIPNSVTSIGWSAFEGCSSLTSVTIPNSVTWIGENAFSGCSSLTSPVYNAHCFAYMPISYSGAYAILEGIKQIAGGAFFGCSSLTSVTIPNSVTSIGEKAFALCSSLTSVTIPSSVVSIGAAAFANCNAIRSVTCEGAEPPYIQVQDWYYDEIFRGIYVVFNVYVPCGSLEKYKNAQWWKEYASQMRYLPFPYIISQKAVNGYVSFPSIDSLTICDESVQVTAIPDRGCYFVRWADGNTENPRTIELTQDTTMEAIFDYLLEGKCGKDSALTWTLDTTTMALNITGKGALSENYTYGTFIESLTIGNEITSIGEWAFGECNNLKTVIIGSSVKVLEAAAFAYCSSIDTITCYSQRPPTVKQDALYGIKYSTIVYVPASYLNYYVMHDAWGLYDVRPMGIALTLSANNAAYGTLVGAGTYAQNATVTFSAKPNNGYHFARWSDGNTENPRTIILTQDTTFTAVFETSKSGVCGHNNALQWTYDGQSRTLTITGRAALDENYTFGVEALTQMRTLIIGNDVTAIGDSAFYGVSSIYHLEIGANVASIGNYTFAECRRLEDITCYAEDVPVINATTFDNVGNKQYIYLYVPDGRERAYKRDEFWGEFDVQVKGAETVSDPVDDVIVNPSDNTADITWPVVNNAGTYEITITKDDVVVCTLIFNANGQLAGIAFAPGKEGRAHYAQAATLTANGFRFTITGLTSATKYGYSVVSKNTSNAVVDTKSGTFTTTGSQQVPTNLDQIGSSQDGTKGRLVLHNGQIFILRNGKTYTMQGQEVK